MKKSLKVLCILALLICTGSNSAYAIVYQPNTNIPVEEITTQSSPTIATRTATANPEGSWKQDSIGWWWEYPDGNMEDSPSEQYVSYGHVFDDINTVTQAQVQTNILYKAGFEGTVRTNRKASDVLKGYVGIPDHKPFLNSGLFICNGHGGPGNAIFSDITALTGTLSGKDSNGYDCTSISGNTMNNCKIALFFGCETALIENSGANVGKGDLLETAQLKGALGVFGFNQSVLHSSDNKFASALVEQLAVDKTLKEAAEAAKLTLPLWDACGDYRIVGGDAKFTIAAETYSNKAQVSIPQDETYALFKDDGNYKTYVQLINGVMTSDYYITNSEGDVIALRNEIAEDNFANVATASNALMVNSTMDFDSESFNVYEKVDGEIRLLKITQEEVSHNGYNTLEITVQDVETGAIIPYEDILSNY